MTIQEKLVLYFREKGLTIAVAESCTGGLISKKITDVSGSSEIFGYGLVTYANEAKEKLLGVSEKTLSEYGAVSHQTAYEMAKGLLALSGADISVATTGIAGPGGGTKEKPVGLVYVGIGAKDGEIRTEKLLISSFGDRSSIRDKAADTALTLAYEAAIAINKK